MPMDGESVERPELVGGRSDRLDHGVGVQALGAD